MRDREIGVAPNYTIPALVMAGINLTWVFFVLWALWGLAAPLLVAACLHHLIGRFAVWRSR